MMFMPIMITVTMLFAPAGLVIYWLVSNVWSIGQQYFTNSVDRAAEACAGAGRSRDKAGEATPRRPPDIVVPPYAIAE